MARLRLLGLAAVLLCVACSDPLDGRPDREVAPLPSAADALAQSAVDLREAAAVRYRGGMTTPSGDPVTVDVTVTHGGEATGTMTVNGKPASILVLDRNVYLRAAEDFWTTLPGVPDATAPAVADRWTRVPGSVLGVNPADLLTPSVLGASLGTPRPDAPPLAQRPPESVNGIDTVRIETDSGSVHLAVGPPRGIVRLESRKAGRTDVTKVRDLSLDVTDASAELASVYQELIRRGQQLDVVIDPFLHVQQGGYRFADCGATSCAIVVDFSNPSPTPVRVLVRATWTGDGRRLGSCSVVGGPVSRGQGGGAKCVIDSPEWVAFYRRAHSAPGQHPYEATWSAVALVEPPDLNRLAAMGTATSRPQDTSLRRADGSHHVYVIHEVNGGIDRGVWKYGVAEGAGWQADVSGQLPLCRTATGSLCAVGQVSATDDMVSAHVFRQALVQSYRFRNGACPPAQWAACPR